MRLRRRRPLEPPADWPAAEQRKAQRQAQSEEYLRTWVATTLDPAWPLPDPTGPALITGESFGSGMCSFRMWTLQLDACHPTKQTGDRDAALKILGEYLRAETP